MNEDIHRLIVQLLPKLPKDLDHPELKELRKMLSQELDMLELEIEELLQLQDNPLSPGMIFVDDDGHFHMFVMETEDTLTFLDMTQGVLTSYDEEDSAALLGTLRFTLNHPLNVGWLLTQLKNLRVHTTPNHVTVGQGVGCVGDTLAEAVARAWIQEREV